MIRVFSLLALGALSPLALANDDGEERACCARDIRAGTPFTLTGTIVDFDRGEWDLDLRDENGVVYDVLCIGPNWYWEDQGVERPREGDTVTIEGYLIQCGDDIEYAAARVTSGNRTVELRDEDGMPRWAGPRGR